MILSNPIINDPKWIFTHSQIAMFKQCRQKYWFNYIEKLESKALVRPLYEGRLIHEAIAEYYGQKNQNKLPLNEIKEIISNKINGIITTQRQELDNAYEIPNEEMDEKLDKIEEEVLTVIDHYIAYAEEHDKFEFIAPEQNFEYKIDDHLIVSGKIDGIIKEPDGIWLIEHKTTSSKDFTDYIKTLMLDEQLELYLFIMKQITGKEIKGVIYNIIRKKIPTKPKILKDGSVSKDSRIDTTVEVFKKALKDNNCDEKDYEQILEMLKKNEFIKRERIFRTSNDLQAFFDEWLETLKALTSPKILIYKNPWNCKIMKCPYYTLCVEDTEENRKFNFNIRKEVNQELEEEI